MLRTNGGLIGAKRSPSLSTASGVWSVAEQATNARAVQWPGQSPVAGLSPLFWYDFADESTVTLSGSEISTITDKGTRGWALSKSSTGPLYSDGINGLKCCNWGSAYHSNYLRNTTSTSTVIAEIYVVLDADFGSTFTGFAGLITGTSGSAWQVNGSPVGGTPTGTGFDGSGGFSGAYLNGSSTNSFSAAIVPTINSASLLRITGSATSTSGIQLGADRNNSGRGWSGLIGEVIVFTSTLTSGDRTTLQNYLAKKWGLTLA